MRGDYVISEYTEHLRKKIIGNINYLGELKRQGKIHTLEYQEVESKIHFASIALKRRYEVQTKK